MNMTEDRALSLFLDLVRIPSVSATPGEEAVCACLEGVLREYGIASERICRVKERPNLLARIRAQHPQRPPLVLISHIDVVPAAEERWSHPPFAAETAEGRIFGRGTLDTKHLTVMELYAFLHLAGHEAQLNRDVCFLATVDEEQGSAYGMGYVRSARPELFAGAVVINEGGGFPLHINGQNYMMLTAGEKAVCRVRLWAEGDAGHASAPSGNQAMLKMAEGIRRIFEHEAELTMGCHDVHERMEGIVGSSEWDNPVAMDIFGYSGQNAVTMRNYQMGVKSNVVPGLVETVLDFRVLPGTKPEEVTGYVQRCLEGTQVHWELLGFEEGFVSGKEDLEAFAAHLEKACLRNGFEGRVLPMLALGRTDGRFFAGTGSQVYGCSPLTMGDSFDVVLPKVHGDDESILVDSFRFGCRVLDEVIQGMAGVCEQGGPGPQAEEA